MRFLALATDYDGTVAQDGRIDEGTIKALERCKESGRKLLLVTGRILPELKSVCSCLPLFDLVVAENGALLYDPATDEETLLAAAPSESFLQSLAAHGAPAPTVGRVIVATWAPHEVAVLKAIAAVQLEYQVIFNKGAVMVLPSGINKATGLTAALTRLKLSPHNVVGVGDAENDHAFLELCEASAAVANALDTVKSRVDLVTELDHGAGVTQLIEMLLDDDLVDLESKLTRHNILIGHTPAGAEVTIRSSRNNVLIVGKSGAGKSTLATALVERLQEHHYQFCIFDPEGDYQGFDGAISFGTADHPPDGDELVRFLETTDQNAVINLIGVRLADRPAEFVKLLSALQHLRTKTGRPHWIIVDEAHHVLPATWEPTELALPPTVDCLAYITMEPNLLHVAALKTIHTLLAVGKASPLALHDFCNCIGVAPPEIADEPKEGEILYWDRQSLPLPMKPIPSRTERRRHIRKYAEGELPPDRSFYFRGPDDKLKLRAQNLMMFLELADGVDDETWTFHRERGDYSAWLRAAIKDEDLAKQATEIERSASLDPKTSRQQFRELIEQKYTAPGGRNEQESKSPEPTARPAMQAI
jgi:hydroxymethylpyrimidine pyrophosphatase-like HAD family hydrolase